jgi:hypothetical protein
MPESTRPFLLLLLSGVLLATAAPFVVPVSAQRTPREATPRCDAATYAAQADALPEFEVEHDGATYDYVVMQGDLLLTRTEAVELIKQSCLGARDKPRKARQATELNFAVSANGAAEIWARSRRELSYAVDRASFPSDSAYQRVVGLMSTATRDWVTACAECGFSFNHRQALDSGTARIANGVPGAGEVTFVVRYLPAETEFIAAAFFPNDPVYKRKLYIAPSFFTSKFAPAGVLRHELGHVIGYRHEHLGVVGCPPEDTRVWRSVAGYTPNSVMHYLCGKGGTRTLDIVAADKSQHRMHYGKL